MSFNVAITIQTMGSEIYKRKQSKTSSSFGLNFKTTYFWNCKKTKKNKLETQKQNACYSFSWSNIFFLFLVYLGSKSSKTHTVVTKHHFWMQKCIQFPFINLSCRCDTWKQPFSLQTGPFIFLTVPFKIQIHSFPNPTLFK